MRLTSTDDHAFDAYVAESAAARAAIVVVQEIFGVNSHIRSVTEDYAQQGYSAMAPALFDRAERNVELGYGPDDRKRGMHIAAKVGLESALMDVAAAVKRAAQMFGSKRVGVVGFCWGGSLAWLAATRLAIGAAVGYYGGANRKIRRGTAALSGLASFRQTRPTHPAVGDRNDSQSSSRFANLPLRCRPRFQLRPARQLRTRRGRLGTETHARVCAPTPLLGMTDAHHSERSLQGRVQIACRK